METCRWSVKIVLSILFLITLAACGTFQIDLEDQATSDVEPTLASPPVEVLVARDLALLYLRATFTDKAPADNLEWSARLATPDGLVGATNYLFETSGWTMTVAFPIVAPESTIYTIEVLNGTSGFHWVGQVDAQGQVMGMAEHAGAIPVVAWAGRFRELAEGAGADDYFVILPEGTGAVGVEGVDEQLESLIALNDMSDDDYVHVWGELTCNVEDFNGCRILIDRIRYGLDITSPESVKGWEGVIYSSPFPPGSGGDDYFALVGEFPVQFGIWAEDGSLRAELEGLRDTQVVIRLWGEIVAGIPDWNGTQIKVERYELIDQPSGPIPPAPERVDDGFGWLTYVNQRYGYLFRYPPSAEIEEIGPQGFQVDENGIPLGGLPDGVTLDTYLDYLEENYGNNLCVGIHYGLGYIYISAAENVEARYAICGRTGVGVAEIIQKEEELIIDGISITATGMEIVGEGESLAGHNETMVIRLAEGTRIEYGAAPRFDATYEDYLTKTRPVLLQIVQSFEFTE